MTTARVAAQAISVQLGGTTILHGVDLTVAPRQFVALLGANGSGKSTLVKSLLGIVPLASGTVHLYGQPLGNRTPWHRIGYVPQRSLVSAGVPATAREVVISGLLAGQRLRLPKNARALAQDALEIVGLAHRQSTPIGHLSGGQQQRVLIARALVRTPDLLVLDEPMAGVDADSQLAFAQTLTHLRSTGTSLLMVLHEIGPLKNLIGRAVVLKNGNIISDGPLAAADNTEDSSPSGPNSSCGTARFPIPDSNNGVSQASE